MASIEENPSVPGPSTIPPAAIENPSVVPKASVTSRKSGQEEDEDPPHKHHNCCIQILYYIISFAAYWFGAEQFDYDGDGDFDIDDVEVMFGMKPKPRAKRMSKKMSRNSSSNPKGTQAEPKAKAEPKPAVGGIMGMLDKDGDGQIGFGEVFGGKDGKFDLIDDFVEADVEEEDFDGDGVADTQEKLMLKHWPIFIAVQCAVALGIWAIFSFQECAANENGFCYNGQFLAKAGLESIFPRMTDLRITDHEDCADYRFQVWRWLSYQFTHVGAGHVCMNVFLNIVVGLPLNGFHGNLRLWFMFNISVFGGAMGWAAGDIQSPTVGMSGGCYGLIGISLADLIMNWSQKKYRKPHLVMLIFLAGAETANYYLAHSDGPKPSNSAHIGGFTAGLCMGIVVGVNLKEEKWEKVFKIIIAVVGFALMAFCVTWQFANWPPRSIFTETGWCWLRQVSNTTIFGDMNYQCVICGEEECIKAWSLMKYAAPVSDYLCNTEVMGGGYKCPIDTMPELGLPCTQR